jgi:hypothetical protein
VTAIRRHLAVLADRREGDLEGACVHCGACCKGRVVVNDLPVQVPALWCKFLRVDAEGKSRCSVYHRRHEVAPWCRSLEHGIAKGLYPADCPYVADLAAYQGTAVLDDASYGLVEEAIVRYLRDQPRPEWADPAVWAEYVGGRS